MFNPQKFAHNLKNSTLNKKEQEALLELLPNLTNEQIDEISSTLEKDVKEQKQILDKVQLKSDIFKKNAKKEIEKKLLKQEK